MIQRLEPCIKFKDSGQLGGLFFFYYYPNVFGGAFLTGQVDGLGHNLGSLQEEQCCQITSNIFRGQTISTNLQACLVLTQAAALFIKIILCTNKCKRLYNIIALFLCLMVEIRSKLEDVGWYVLNLLAESRQIFFSVHITNISCFIYINILACVLVSQCFAFQNVFYGAICEVFLMHGALILKVSHYKVLQATPKCNPYFQSERQTTNWHKGTCSFFVL